MNNNIYIFHNNPSFKKYITEIQNANLSKILKVYEDRYNPGNCNFPKPVHPTCCCLKP